MREVIAGLTLAHSGGFFSYRETAPPSLKAANRVTREKAAAL